MNTGYSSQKNSGIFNKNSGFTLVEIMFVVAIIALLAAIAVPGHIRARHSAQNADFMNSLRVYAGALDQYLAENLTFPADSNTGQLDADFANYIDPASWYKGPSIGGEWDIEGGPSGLINAGVGSHRFTVSDERLLTIDEKFDDGDLTTGLLQKIANDRYYYVVQD